MLQAVLLSALVAGLAHSLAADEPVDYNVLSPAAPVLVVPPVPVPVPAPVPVVEPAPTPEPIPAPPPATVPEPQPATPPAASISGPINYAALQFWLLVAAGGTLLCLQWRLTSTLSRLAQCIQDDDPR